MDLPEDREREAVGRLIARIDAYWRSVVPVFGFQNGKAVQDRTGILFQVADHHFLITASHDLNWISENVPIFIAPHGPGIDPIQLTGRMTGTEDASIDIAIMRLASENVEYLLPERQFLRMTSLDFLSRSSNGIYVVQGYPVELGRIDMDVGKVRTRGMRYCTDIYEGELPAMDYPFDDDIHVSLQHHLDEHDLSGNAIKSPKITGMSGGAIWRLAESIDGKLEVNEPKLVAVQTKAKTGEFLKGTWIKYALELIAKTYPELRPAMSLLV